MIMLMRTEKYIIFEDIRRNRGEDIGEFMIRFDRAMNQAKAIEIFYPDNVLAFKLMRSMNLSTDEQKMIMTACTEIKYATMQSAIKRILSGKSSAGGSNEIRIKQETQESFYDARGAYSNNNQGYRAGKKMGYSKNPQYSSNGYQQQHQPQGKIKQVNPKDRFGNTILCLLCDSKYHLIRQCPQKVAPSYFTRLTEKESEAEPNLENVTDNVKFQYFTKEFASPQAIYLAESLGNANIFINCSDNLICSGNLEGKVSHHSPAFCFLNHFLPPEENEQIKCPKYDYCESKVDEFLSKIHDSIFLENYTYDTENFLKFIDTLKNEIELCFRVDEQEFEKSKRNFYVNPWITPGIIASVRKNIFIIDYGKKQNKNDLEGNNTFYIRFKSYRK